MTPEELKNQIEGLASRVDELQRTSIQLNIDPTTSLYLQRFVNIALLALPTQTYSTSAPSGSAPAGSVWFYDTGSLATREIYMYSGVTWIKFK